MSVAVTVQSWMTMTAESFAGDRHRLIYVLNLFSDFENKKKKIKGEEQRGKCGGRTPQKKTQPRWSSHVNIFKVKVT